MSESVDVLFASCYWSMSGKNKGFVATPPQGWPGQYVGGCAFVRSWGVRIQKQSKVCSVLIWYSQYLSIKVRMVILIRFWLWWFFCIAFLIFIFFDFQYLLSFLHHTYMWKVQFHAFIHVWCVWFCSEKVTRRRRFVTLTVCILYNYYIHWCLSIHRVWLIVGFSLNLDHVTFQQPRSIKDSASVDKNLQESKRSRLYRVHDPEESIRQFAGFSIFPGKRPTSEGWI